MTSQSFNWTISHPARVLSYYVLFFVKTNIWNVSNSLFQGRRCERFGSDRWQRLWKGEASDYWRTCVPVLSWDCWISVTFCITFRNVSKWKFRASQYVGSRISQRESLNVTALQRYSNLLILFTRSPVFCCVCRLFPHIFGSTLERNVFLLPWGFQSAFKVLMVPVR